MGLTNIKVMVPFCRTPEEGKRVIEAMAEFGLVQGENDLEFYVMCEIPSNSSQRINSRISSMGSPLAQMTSPS